MQENRSGLFDAPTSKGTHTKKTTDTFNAINFWEFAVNTVRFIALYHSNYAIFAEKFNLNTK